MKNLYVISGQLVSAESLQEALMMVNHQTV